MGLAHELQKAGLHFRRQVLLPVTYDGRVFARAFTADLIVAEQILVELKSVETILPVHCKQVITYLRLSGLERGLLINFKTDLLKNGLKGFLWDKSSSRLRGPFVPSREVDESS